MVDTLTFKDIKYRKRDRCTVCEKDIKNSTITLPDFPITGVYTDKKPKEKMGFLNQEFFLCDNCGHGQVLNVIDSKLLYGDSYSFKTSESNTATDANNKFISFIERQIGNQRLDAIIEIGCSDLYLLNSLKSKSKKLIGIDPILKEKENKMDNTDIIGDFLENIDLRKYSQLEKKAVICSHTLEHLENPYETIKKIVNELGDETICFFHFPSLDGLLKNRRFDQIFHQHLNYFSKFSFEYLLDNLNQEIICEEENSNYWGSLLVSFRKKSGKMKKKSNCARISEKKFLEEYDLFKKNMRNINEYIESKKIIWGYGAGLMVPSVMYNLKADHEKWRGILDNNRSKENKFYINSPIQIKNPEGVDLRGSSVVITAVDNARNILPKLISYNPQEIILLNGVL